MRAMKLSRPRRYRTLMKSNVQLEDDCIVLTFKAEGRQAVLKGPMRRSSSAPLVSCTTLPGKRLFQYRDNAGRIRTGQHGSSERLPARYRRHQDFQLKDFRTLMASAISS